MKVSFLCLCLLVLVGSCHAGGGAVRGSHTSHHGLMVRTVRKPSAPKEIENLKNEVRAWLQAWEDAKTPKNPTSFHPPTTRKNSPAFVEDIVRDMIANKVSCADDRPFVYTSIFGGNMCFDYLVVRALREYAGFTCDIEIQNIEVVGPTAEEEAYIKHHADVQHIRQYKGVYDFIEEEKKRSPSDVVVSTQPGYDFTVSLKSNPTESQVLRYIMDFEPAALEDRMQGTAASWEKTLNADSPRNSFSLQDLCIATPDSRGKIAIGGETPWRCLQNVRHGLLRLLEMNAEQFEAYTDVAKVGWIPDLGRLFTTNPRKGISDALGVVLDTLSYFEASPDLVVPCFVDECLVYTPKTHHKADESAGVVKYVIDTYRGSEGVLSDSVNSVINAMMADELPSLYKSRSGDLNIALYDVLASTSTESTRAYILRGQSGPEELSGVERAMWQGLKMGSAAEMQVLLKNTVKSKYADKFHLHETTHLSREEAEKLRRFVSPEHGAVSASH